MMWPTKNGTKYTVVGGAKKSTGELSRKHGINLNHEFSWYIYIRSLYKQAVVMILPTSRKAGYTPTEKDIMK